jgi:hypothetical protein
MARGNLPAKLFSKSASRLQVGKAPSTICAAGLSKASSVSRLNASRIVKTQNAAVQLKIQSFAVDSELYDVWVPNLIYDRLFSPHNERAPVRRNRASSLQLDILAEEETTQCDKAFRQEAAGHWLRVKF